MPFFINRQLQEKYLAKKKDLLDEVVWWALRCLGVNE